MKKSEDLKSLLDRLKAETSYDSQSFQEEAALPSQPQLSVKPTSQAQNQPQTVTRLAPFRPPLKETQVNSRFNVVWSENKEALLFCLLSSACVILVGVFAQREYVILAGVISFVLFSIVSFAAFFRYVTAASLNKPSLPYASGGEPRVYSQPVAISGEKERELEGKIEELRSIVKTLSRQQGKNI